jgi:hypothetical protein
MCPMQKTYKMGKSQMAQAYYKKHEVEKMSNFAKQKGNSFEYDCQQSLEQNIFQNVTRTSERGYQRQYDLEVRDNATQKIVAIIECKRLKGISWNQAFVFYDKLSNKAVFMVQQVGATSIVPKPYLLFQSNHQPCLVMYLCDDELTVRRFEDVFGVPFIKHKSTRIF